MAISIDYGNTFVIFVPQSDLTLVSGTLYELDVDAFRLTLKDIEDSEIGMSFPTTHLHNTEVTVAGTTFARTVEILAPYSIEFEDGQYSVRLTGANNNLFDVQNGILVQNQVQVIPSNSAGSTSPGFTQDDAMKLWEVWQDRGLDPDNPKTIDAATENVGLITKIRQKVGGVLTVTRQ